MIKAIETKYHGYKFRSRLEARWAVFFDTLGIDYEYEPEGFQIDTTTYYLPDFYIPSWNTYVEVKANRPNAVEELKKAVKFVNNSNNTVLILSDIPNGTEGLYWFPMIWFDNLSLEVKANWIGLSYSSEEPDAYLIRHFATSYETHPVRNLLNNKMFENQGYQLLHSEPNSSMNWQPGWEFEIDDIEKIALDTAYKKARQARFEHGETPII